MRIALVTPAGAGMRNGNRHTALRWATFLRAAGHTVRVSTEWDAHGKTDLLLALHARRSHASIRAFAQAHADRPLVLALTGTDIYRDIRNSQEAQASLELAHRFIVLQPEALRELAPPYRRRATVVIQSCATQLRHRPAGRRFRVSVVGHLREEKDPLRALAALKRVPGEIEVLHMGASLDPALEKAALDGMAAEPRYRWVGALPHARALSRLAASHAMVISSRMEGGANAVCEALRIGVPVLASRIPGNVGLLGRGYPGYFPLEDDAALARLIVRARDDRTFYRSLKSAVGKLRTSVAPRAEARALLGAVEG